MARVEGQVSTLNFAAGDFPERQKRAAKRRQTAILDWFCKPARNGHGTKCPKTRRWVAANGLFTRGGAIADFNMLRFAEVFSDPQIVHSLSAQLSWTHFRQDIRLNDPIKRAACTDIAVLSGEARAPGTRK